MKHILPLVFLAACSTYDPQVRKEDPIALIQCRVENSCPHADAATIEREEVAINEYCEINSSFDFCEQRRLKAELKTIDSTVSDFTFEVHRPLYNLSEN